MTHAHVRSAADELVNLVCALRDDWDEPEASKALWRCHGLGWSFGQAALELARLAVTEGGQPADLGAARRKGALRAVLGNATDQLAALAVKMRDDWTDGDVRRALASCRGSGWPDAQVTLELVRLAVIPGSEPRDLAAAAQSPFSRRTLGDRRG